MPRLCNPVLLALTQSFRVHTFSLREDPWPNFSFRVAYATQCKSCFRIASTLACLELSSATASATFRYAGFSLRKRNSRTSPLCNFIMEDFDAAQVSMSMRLSLANWQQFRQVARNGRLGFICKLVWANTKSFQLCVACWMDMWTICLAQSWKSEPNGLQTRQESKSQPRTNPQALLNRNQASKGCCSQLVGLN